MIVHAKTQVTIKVLMINSGEVKLSITSEAIKGENGNPSGVFILPVNGEATVTLEQDQEIDLERILKSAFPHGIGHV